jgi:hypothetical protein
MANYRKIVELRPEMADFFRNRRLIAYRGDVLAYSANIRTESFSTDAAGFRHSRFEGKDWSVADCLQESSYGLVLGASNLFGFGVAGNENSLASLLAERFGFPFANAAMPGGNSRHLHSLLIGLMAAGKRPPSVVVLSNGGDLATFCESSIADPVYGSPNRAQLKSLGQNGARRRENDADRSFPRLLAFSALWTSTIAGLCRARQVPMVLVHQSTFFEKSRPTALEVECGLGQPFHPSQQRQFANHRKFDEPFYTKRKAIADALRIPLAGWGMTEDISFIDEFHCDRDGIKVMAKAVGDEIEASLGRDASARLEAELVPQWPLK